MSMKVQCLEGMLRYAIIINGAQSAWDNGWTNLNAQVVCKQLGHSTLSKHLFMASSIIIINKMLIIVGYKGAIFLTNVYYGSGNGIA